MQTTSNILSKNMSARIGAAATMATTSFRLGTGAYARLAVIRIVQVLLNGEPAAKR